MSEYTAETQKLDLSTEAWTQRLANAPIYAKKGMVAAEFVSEPTPVETVLADGTIETSNVADPGDVIVTNPSGEKYVLKPENFAKRYGSTDDPDVFRAKGMARAVQNNTGSPVEIMAPWGEPQFGGPDCMIATVFDPENPEEIGADRYIIGRKEFEETYGLAEEVLTKQ